MIFKNRRDRLFALIMLLVHGIFFLLALCYKRIYMGDSFEYVYEALNIKNSFFFYSGNPALPITEEYMSFRTPLYPLFLTLVYFFSVNNWTVIFLQNILSVINIVCFRQTLMRIGYEKKYDWLLLLLLIAYPAQFIHANTVEPEILLQGFVLLYVHHFIVWTQERQPRSLLIMSLALIGGMMVKPVLYPFTIIHLLMIGAFALRMKKYWLKMILTAMLPFMAMLGYNGWNAARTGKFHFTSNQSFNAIYYFYFYKSSTEGISTAQKFLNEERAKVAAMPVFRDRYDYANQKGKQLLKDNLLPYSLYHLKHCLRFFIEPGKADIDLFTGKLSYGNLRKESKSGFNETIRRQGLWTGSMNYIRQNPILIFVLLIFLGNLIKLFGLVLFLSANGIPPLMRWLIVLLLVYFALLTGPILTPRYVLPVSVIYAGCAVLGWQHWIERRKIKTVRAVH